MATGSLKKLYSYCSFLMYYYSAVPNFYFIFGGMDISLYSDFIIDGPLNSSDLMMHVSVTVELCLSKFSTDLLFKE